MTVLDEVLQMQKSGMDEAQIITQLKSRGVSPKEINDSIAHAKVKTAVSDSPSASPLPQMVARPQDYSPNPSSTAQQPPQNPQMYPPEPSQEPPYQEEEYQDPNFNNQGFQNQNPAQEPSYPEYSQGSYYPDYSSGQTYSQGAYDSQTIYEVAENVVSEKISSLRKDLNDVSFLKNETKIKLSELDERLKKIEDSIDHLKRAIISKIGEFGENSALIHKDLENLHGTVSKVMDPLVDTYHELKKLADSKTPSSKKQSKTI